MPVTIEEKEQEVERIFTKTPTFGLSPRMQHAAMILASGAGTVKCAKQLHVTKQTVSKWQLDPRFDSLYRLHLRRLLKARLARTLRKMDIADEALIQVAQFGKKDADRVSAARTLKEFGMKEVEVEMLLGRLEQLEQAQSEPALPALPPHEQEDTTDTE